MAEGDTVLRAARHIEQALGSKTVAVTAPNPHGCAAGVEKLNGRRLEKVEARGKNLLLDFGGLTLHSHLGMNGAWHVYRPGAAWRKPARAAWVVLSGAEAEVVQFGGSTLRVLRSDRLRLDPWLSRLGPDILAADLDLDGAVRSLRVAPDRELGDALLDQSLIAGIGNIFKSEACFAARVDPWRSIGDLSDTELRNVLGAARTAMQQAVAAGRHTYAVYRRSGRPCPNCGTAILSRGQGDANRVTYWCPSCQATGARLDF